MIEILQLEFMRNALITGILVSIVCGTIGSLVVVNRIVFLAGGIAHAAYGGIGISLFFGIPYLPITLCFSLISSLIVAKITLYLKHRSDTIIGIIWAAGMAIGILFQDLTPGYNVDSMSYLFGSILAVPITELWTIGALSLIILATIIILYDKLLSISYDEEFARISGINVDILYYIMIAMISVSVVMVVRAVGLIMVIALLTISSHIAEKFTKSLHSMMVLSSTLNIVFVSTGLCLSYYYNLTSGASIILVAVSVFGISSIISKN